MNPKLSFLQPYPFEKLAQLKAGATPPVDKKAIVMSVGEPKHDVPTFIKEAVTSNLNLLSNYPTTQGSNELRESIASWLTRRFALDKIDPEQQILPCNGTREALFAIAQCVVNPQPDALVFMPNPFYQIYEGAALLAGARPYFLNTTSQTGFLPDLASVPEEHWKNCQLIYLCSPGNPTGAVLEVSAVEELIRLADKFDFVVASDECYSEIYRDEASPPQGLLQIAAKMGRHDFSRCLVFHSLSKRSSVPGLRSGFIAGDSKIIEKFRLYRTYQGCAMPPPTQAASSLAWQDEEHVKLNRALYRQKFQEVIKILAPVTPVHYPPGSFYLWLKTAGDDQQFVRDLYGSQNLTVLPGSFLSRTADGINPGQGYVRIALVPPLAECVEAATRLKDFISQTREWV